MAFSEIRFEFGLGNSYSLQNTKFTLVPDEGASYDAATYTGQWDTRGFSGPVWYSVKLEVGNDKHTWGIEEIHHKVYLRNVDDFEEIDNYEASDGYNLVFFNYGTKIDDWIFRVGLGTVITHPDITINGETNFFRQTKHLFACPCNGDGYQLDGYAGQLAVAHYWPSFVNTYVEAKITYGDTTMNIIDGKSRLQNTAIHLAGGIKF